MLFKMEQKYNLHANKLNDKHIHNIKPTLPHILKLLPCTHNQRYILRSCTTHSKINTITYMFSMTPAKQTNHNILPFSSQPGEVKDGFPF